MGVCFSKNGLNKSKKKNTPSSPSSSTTSPCPNPISDPKPSQNHSSSACQKTSHEETVNQTVEEVSKPSIVNQQKQDLEEKKCAVVSSSNGEEEIGKLNKRRGSKREQKNGFEEPSPVAVVRTSSCTKEEVDAILIQCGRLSRSSSGKASNENTNQRGLNSSGSKKYSGSKRSYDFQDEGEDDEKQQQTESRPAHRRTPSRERDGEYKRSGSRDRGSVCEDGKRSSGRRVSRSPGRRSETPTEKSRAGKTSSGSGAVSKNNSAAAIETGLTIKRATATANAIKRTVNPSEIGFRSSSPRSRSPVTRGAVGAPVTSMENVPLSLSRNSSRKTDHSPFRRTPTGENDENSTRKDQPPLKAQNQSSSSSKVQRNTENEERVEKLPHSQSQKTKDNGVPTQKSDDRNRVDEIQGKSNSSNRVTREQLLCCRKKDQLVAEKMGEIETQPQTITRTRSSRRSREQFFPDIDLDETLPYHHQQTAFSLPACVSKACSILEAVADLNSCTSSTVSFNEKSFEADDRNRLNGLSNHSGERKTVSKDCDPSSPFVESKVVGHDDLMEPTFHKYVSVRDLGREMEQQESSGSNSFINNQWTSWDGEPTSADSTDRWNSSSSSALMSKSYTSEEVEESLEPQSHGGSDFGERRLRRGSGNSLLPVVTLSKKRDFQHGGTDAKVGLRSFPVPAVAAAASL